MLRMLQAGYNGEQGMSFLFQSFVKLRTLYVTYIVSHFVCDLFVVQKVKFLSKLH